MTARKMSELDSPPLKELKQSHLEEQEAEAVPEQGQMLACWVHISAKQEDVYGDHTGIVHQCFDPSPSTTAPKTLTRVVSKLISTSVLSDDPSSFSSAVISEEKAEEKEEEEKETQPSKMKKTEFTNIFVRKRHLHFHFIRESSLVIGAVIYTTDESIHEELFEWLSEIKAKYIWETLPEKKKHFDRIMVMSLVEYNTSINRGRHLSSDAKGTASSAAAGSSSSSSSLASSTDHPKKRLLKYGTFWKCGGRIKTWYLRYFELYDNSELHYWSNEEDHHSSQETSDHSSTLMSSSVNAKGTIIASHSGDKKSKKGSIVIREIGQSVSIFDPTESVKKFKSMHDSRRKKVKHTRTDSKSMTTVTFTRKLSRRLTGSLSLLRRASSNSDRPSSAVPSPDATSLPDLGGKGEATTEEPLSSSKKTTGIKKLISHGTSHSRDGSLTVPGLISGSLLMASETDRTESSSSVILPALSESDASEATPLSHQTRSTTTTTKNKMFPSFISSHTSSSSKTKIGRASSGRTAMCGSLPPPPARKAPPPKGDSKSTKSEADSKLDDSDIVEEDEAEDDDDREVMDPRVLAAAAASASAVNGEDDIDDEELDEEEDEDDDVPDFFGLSISTSKREYQFVFESQNQRDEWFAILQKMIERSMNFVKLIDEGMSELNAMEQRCKSRIDPFLMMIGDVGKSPLLAPQSSSSLLSSESSLSSSKIDAITLDEVAQQQSQCKEYCTEISMALLQCVKLRDTSVKMLEYTLYHSIMTAALLGLMDRLEQSNSTLQAYQVRLYQTRTQIEERQRTKQLKSSLLSKSTTTKKKGKMKKSSVDGGADADTGGAVGFLSGVSSETGSQSSSGSTSTQTMVLSDEIMLRIVMVESSIISGTSSASVTATVMSDQSHGHSSSPYFRRRRVFLHKSFLKVNEKGTSSMTADSSSSSLSSSLSHHSSSVASDSMRPSEFPLVWLLKDVIRVGQSGDCIVSSSSDSPLKGTAVSSSSESGSGGSSSMFGRIRLRGKKGAEKAKEKAERRNEKCKELGLLDKDIPPNVLAIKHRSGHVLQLRFGTEGETSVWLTSLQALTGIAD